MNANGRIKCHECEAMNEASAAFCRRCGASLQTAVSSSPFPRRHRLTANGAALGLAALVFLLATLFALGAIVYRTTLTEEEVIDPLAGRPGTTATTSPALPGEEGSPAEGESPGTTESRGVVIRPHSAGASSALKSTTRTDFRATNLLDEDLETAWNEGADGPGLGEWVRFNFAEPVILTRIEIANGYQKDDERFNGAARVRSLRLDYSNGTTQLVDLLDTKDVQAVMARSNPTEWLKMTITAVYPDYVWDDAAMSEVRLFALPTQ
jgi:hypothetical protein